MEADALQAKVNDIFKDAFGRTPLRERMNDIEGESQELVRATDLEHIEEETGDLLASLFQLCNENSWSAATLIANSLKKIERRKKQYHTLGRKTKVVIVGGSFDPIHDGHIDLGNFILRSSREFDEVWYAPCFSHMGGKEELAPSKDRIAMCEIALRHDARMKVFPYEVDKRLAGDTYNFIKRLLEEDWAKDQYNFSFAIGQDNANSFPSWVNSELLEKMIRFVVIPRNGVEFDPKVIWYLRAPHIYLQPDKPLIRRASKDLRRDLKMKMGKPEGIDSEVYRYICQNRLYGN